jgi:PIN domain nuclease of toxin-antitoxin system
MATDFVTDTHGLIWYLEDSPRLGPQALAAFDACDRGECIIYIPTICLVEIVYLQEKGRIRMQLFEQLRSDLASGATGLALANLTLVTARPYRAFHHLRHKQRSGICLFYCKLVTLTRLTPPP